MPILQTLCVQDKKKMLYKNYQIIIHKIVHKDVCHVALFVKKKKEMT
jgi:hypothetical protein